MKAQTPDLCNKDAHVNRLRRGGTLSHEYDRGEETAWRYVVWVVKGSAESDCIDTLRRMSELNAALVGGLSNSRSIVVEYVGQGRAGPHRAKLLGRSCRGQCGDADGLEAATQIESVSEV